MVVEMTMPRGCHYVCYEWVGYLESVGVNPVHAELDQAITASPRRGYGDIDHEPPLFKDEHAPEVGSGVSDTLHWAGLEVVGQVVEVPLDALEGELCFLREAGIQQFSFEQPLHELESALCLALCTICRCVRCMPGHKAWMDGK
jgi:hypothetical protein